MKTLADLLKKARITPAGCWEWIGAADGHGYGTGRFEGRTHKAHRIAYRLCTGPIPAGLQIDHLCRNRRCVNPAHLEAVSRSENCRRGLTGKAYGAVIAARTHCPSGHEYTPTNTYRWRNHRQCRECRRRHDQARRRSPPVS